MKKINGFGLRKQQKDLDKQMRSGSGELPTGRDVLGGISQTVKKLKSDYVATGFHRTIIKKLKK